MRKQAWKEMVNGPGLEKLPKENSSKSRGFKALRSQGSTVMHLLGKQQHTKVNFALVTE